LTDYNEIEEILKVGRPLKTLWNLVSKWHYENDRYLVMSFSDLIKEEVEENIRNAYKTIHELDSVLNFDETDNPKIVLERLSKDLDEFCTTCMPIIVGLLSEKIKQRHWNELRDHLYGLTNI
jgi:hypothetical protein